MLFDIMREDRNTIEKKFSRLQEMQDSRISIDYYVFGFIGALAAIFGHI